MSIRILIVESGIQFQFSPTTPVTDSASMEFDLELLRARTVRFSVLVRRFGCHSNLSHI
jgi:hypothetical protein